MNKLVSIVLPVYNGEKYLAQSIESVLNQTYKNIELIIVNDCSTDSSEEIILKYKSQDDRIVYIKNDVNSKLPQSLNNGFAIAKGEYYSWTSDDNMYHQNAIETMMKSIENDSNLALVYFDYNAIDSDGNFKFVIKIGENEDLYFNNVIGACFLYKSSVAKEIGGYDSSLFLVEDYEYWLRINLHYKIKGFHEVLYDYRFHEGSLTESKKEEVKIALGKLMWMYLPKYEAIPMPDDFLVSYYNYILQFKTNRINRIFLRMGFSIKHKAYFRDWINQIKQRVEK